ncbi:hypothetical protein CROQUDRAFT_715519 [Cronartium quercuum f. sp. fusiforme G11]|uniref:Uncharacterized protein n=1 Tax=Cronartium quercuum f. sp. fusiforme G11 TaxID=708437 RepID=A0A9P6TBS5_9BASI|nr:hypothetical protein CROQUDRAFT_715519 [Cronartium quercuum f. sp. fusiforme G11]
MTRSIAHHLSSASSRMRDLAAGASQCPRTEFRLPPPTAERDGLASELAFKPPQVWNQSWKACGDPIVGTSDLWDGLTSSRSERLERVLSCFPIFGMSEPVGLSSLRLRFTEPSARRFEFGAIPPPAPPRFGTGRSEQIIGADGTDGRVYPCAPSDAEIGLDWAECFRSVKWFSVASRGTKWIYLMVDRPV